MTESSDLTLPAGPKIKEAEEAGSVRGPVKQVRLLLPVWGEQYIAQFLRISLPTLLAPGNLPAVAASVTSTLVFLTNTDGVALLRAHPATAFLKTVCDVEFEVIDDLITGDNYSTTLTLAYARAVRAPGPAMLDTCFFFLISDYIMADGSLANVLSRVLAGSSGVQAGNFQVVEEDAKESLFQKFETGEPSVAIAPRDLMGWALNYLHPMTLANTVNFSIFHSSHSNRLFWRVDETTLIGRFYLMHMIAIRPEVMDFQVGSSCDYSFIPEMCPSGNVDVVADSDDYLVVEMQSRMHEEKFIGLGAMGQSALIASLSEWTTARHRANAKVPVIYHAANGSPALPAMIDESRRFIETIGAALPAPQPFRNHPYWIGAITSHRREVARRQPATNPASPPAKVRRDYRDFLFHLRALSLGRGSQVRPWHPRWPDYRMIRKLIERYIPRGKKRGLLTISNRPDDFVSWPEIEERGSDAFRIGEFLKMSGSSFSAIANRYESCVLVLAGNELPILPELLTQIRRLLKPGRPVVVFVINGTVGLDVSWSFNRDILERAGRFFDGCIAIDDIKFVQAGWVASAAIARLRRLFSLSMRRPLYFLPAGFLMAVQLSFSLVGNWLRDRSVSQSPGNDLCSSVGMALRVRFSLPVAEEESSRLSEIELARQRFEVKKDSRVPADAS